MIQEESQTTEQDNNATMMVRGLTLLLKQHDPTEAWEWQ
jgi:hypothetical protein